MNKTEKTYFEKLADICCEHEKKIDRQQQIIKVLREGLEEISWGINESPPDVNGIKFVRIKSKLEIEGIANNALSEAEKIEKEGKE